MGDLDRYDLLWNAPQQSFDQAAQNTPHLFTSDGLAEACKQYHADMISVDVTKVEHTGTVLVAWSIRTDNSTNAADLARHLSDALGEPAVTYWNLDTEDQWEERLRAHFQATYPDVIHTISQTFPDWFGPSITAYSDDETSLDALIGSITLRSPHHLISIGHTDSGERPSLHVPRPTEPRWEAWLTRPDDLVKDDPPHISVTADTLDDLLSRVEQADTLN